MWASRARTGIALVGASLSRLVPPCAAQGRFSRLHGSDESFTPADEIFLLRASAQSLDAERHHLAQLGTYVGVGVGTLQPGNLASVRCLVLGRQRRAAANAREARIPEQGARARACARVSSPATRSVLASTLACLLSGPAPAERLFSVPQSAVFEASGPRMCVGLSAVLAGLVGFDNKSSNRSLHTHARRSP